MLTPEFATPADLALCRQLIRQGSKSFHLASLLLPTRYREHARGLYGFCRVADDLVDHADAPQDAVNELALRLDHIYAGTPYDVAADRAFADVVHRFGIPRAVPDALIEGFAWDAEGHQYDTQSDVTAYAVRVAGTVGVMMSLIMGERRPQALARAIDLGIAMQFSNIARDLEDDAALGRVYVPADWLVVAGTTADDVLRNSRLGANAASRLVDEAEFIYQRSASGIAMLPRACRASINAARLMYREIGVEAQNRKHQGRAVVPLARKLSLVAKAVTQAPFLASGEDLACVPEAQFLIDAVAKTTAPLPAYQGVVGQFDWVVKLFMAVETRKS
jgi:15-cis-phytoene synthase